MARVEKKFELRRVDDLEETKVPVLRHESEKTTQRAKPVRLSMPDDAKVNQRLELPAREDFESRTHQPGIEALIDTAGTSPDILEHGWEGHSPHHKTIPWGWFMLIGLIVAGGIIWSLTGVRKAGVQADKIRVETQSVLENEAKEELEAGRLIDRIDTVTRQFFETTSVAALAQSVRHPERVHPLMAQYYAAKPIPINRVVRTNLFQPLSLDNRSNFWMATVELADHSNRNLVLEILDSGEPKVDWETLVCYQPMKWDTFAIDRPAGRSMDFRVYLEADNFFSHEFANSTHWNCYRLTALDGNESLFGYAKADQEVAESILILLKQNQGRKTSVILRLSIPEGIQSRRGVVIEKMMSPRWIYLNPPEV